MRSAPIRRTITAILVVALAGVGLLSGSAPAGAAGLALRPTTATTGLAPGAEVTVRISGASARQVLQHGVCATGLTCAPTATVRADARGAATITVTLVGTATHGSRVKACRPDRCRIVVQPQGRPAAAVSLAVRFVGERVSATVAPGTGLVDGRTVTVRGRVRGAEGRTVRAIQTNGTCTTGPCTATVGQARVAGDGTFTLTGPVRATLPGTGGRCTSSCQIATSVVGDPSHGIAATVIGFQAAGLTATATPRFDLVDRQAVRVTGTQAGLAGRTVRVRQIACDVTDPAAPVCSGGPSVTATLDAQGRLSATLAVRRLVGAEDCAADRYPVPDCALEVTALTTSGAADPTVATTRTAVYFAPVA